MQFKGECEPGFINWTRKTVSGVIKVTSSWWPLLSGHLSNTDTSLSPFDVRIRDVRMYNMFSSGPQTEKKDTFLFLLVLVSPRLQTMKKSNKMWETILYHVQIIFYIVIIVLWQVPECFSHTVRSRIAISKFHFSIAEMLITNFYLTKECSFENVFAVEF